MLMLPIGSERGLNQGEILPFGRGSRRLPESKCKALEKAIRLLISCLSLVSRTDCDQVISSRSYPKNKTPFELDNFNDQVPFPLFAFKPFVFVERLFYSFTGR